MCYTSYAMLLEATVQAEDFNIALTLRLAHHRSLPRRCSEAWSMLRRCINATRDDEISIGPKEHEKKWHWIELEPAWIKETGTYPMKFTTPPTHWSFSGLPVNCSSNHRKHCNHSKGELLLKLKFQCLFPHLSEVHRIVLVNPPGSASGSCTWIPATTISSPWWLSGRKTRSKTASGGDRISPRHHEMKN